MRVKLLINSCIGVFLSIFSMMSYNQTKIELLHNQTNKMTCAPSEDSDQPGHLPSLIRVFAVRSVGSYEPKPSDWQRRCWLEWGDALSDLSLCWVHGLVLSCSCSNMSHELSHVQFETRYCINWWQKNTPFKKEAKKHYSALFWSKEKNKQL